jgi:hypothetical protein
MRAQDPLRIPDAMIDVHLHLPAGAHKKDGLSAGATMVRSPLFLSGFGSKMTVVGWYRSVRSCPSWRGSVPPTTAMTGEVRQKLVTCFSLLSLLHECSHSVDHSARTGIARRRNQRKGVGRALCRRQ